MIEINIMIKNYIRHIKTINLHKKYVYQSCKKMGIPLQGLLHDLSKYSPTEMSVAKYYLGTGSPHNKCREINGYSKSWLHHKYRNKHHWQFWLDDSETGEFIPIKMPYKYVIESICDMIGAGKAYCKDKWNTKNPLEYWNNKCEGKRLMHPTSLDFQRRLLQVLASYENEDDFYNWYNNTKEKLELDYNNDIIEF